MVAWIILLLSIFLFLQAAFSLYLMLYTWERPERMAASAGPKEFIAPKRSFTVLLPARHEEAVIHDTILRVWNANYPKDLLEIVVVCHDSDGGTIAEAERAIKSAGGSGRVRVETFSGEKINKPRGLNIGLERTQNEVVTIFDAEDDVDPEIFNVINTTMEQDDSGIVQAGVQLMNFRDYWFSVHNCLEYFFWFKSRLHFHAKVGMIPLGGNTVFIRRDLLEKVDGWDEDCLTEDADVGLRLSSLGEKIEVVYDAQHVTREETPDTLASFIKQRTRWNQGFLQILKKGSWRGVSGAGRKALAIYTLSYPFFQAAVTVLWAIAVAMTFFVKVPLAVAMVSFLPLYALVVQMVMTAAGALVFSREYGMKCPPQTLIGLCVTFIPFQIVLGLSAIRAIYRESRQMNTWEKTEHVGAHRKPEIFVPNEYELLLDEAMAHLDADRGSVLLLDDERRELSIRASRGLPDEVFGSAGSVSFDGSVAGWAMEHDRPLLIGRGAKPGELHERLRRRDLKSSMLVPVRQPDGETAIICIASTRQEFRRSDLDWLDERVSSSALSESDSYGRVYSLDGARERKAG